MTLDPGNIEALVRKAYLDTQKTTLYPTDDKAAQLAAAEAALTKALSLAPEHAAAHATLGFVQFQTKRAVQGIAQYERALALDRNLARAHAGIGLAKLSIGRGEETEAHVQEALRLSPRDTFAYLWLGIAGNGKLHLGKDDEAVIRFRGVLEINRNYPGAYFWLAAALAHLDRLDEAVSTVQAGLALDPAFTIRRYYAGALSDNPIYLAQRERVVEGLRRAGVPE